MPTTNSLLPGQPAPAFRAQTHDGQDVDLSVYRGKKVLLSFYRYAGCPFCNESLKFMLAYEPSMRQSGIQFLAVFESRADRFPKFIGGKKESPFPLISDPSRSLYGLYRLESKTAGFFHPIVIWRFLRALLQGFRQGWPDGRLNQLPAYFLISGEGTIESTYYGKHIADTIQPGHVQELIRQSSGSAPAYDWKKWIS